MPELRYNSATREWVIISTERAKRPEDFALNPCAISGDARDKCPFCPGHEDKSPKEIYALRDPGTQPSTPGWQVRVVPNAFPALASEGAPTRSKTKAGFVKMNGVGEHEVIIESPEHDQVIATMELAQVEKVMLTYKERFIALSNDPRIESIILFKNHGRGAGTSLSHPHSQLVALPVIPRSMHERLEIGQEHYDEFGSCLYCDLIEMEKAEGERIVTQNEKFIAFVPFASRMPFEMWVLPKNHSSGFEEITDQECRDLAGIMKDVLGKLYRAVNNPDFNYAVYSSPCGQRELAHYHWNIKIFPRVSNPAGFEVGSGLTINSVVPEMAAQYLRDAK